MAAPFVSPFDSGPPCKFTFARSPHFARIFMTLSPNSFKRAVAYLHDHVGRKLNKLLLKALLTVRVLSDNFRLKRKYPKYSKYSVSLF